MRVWNILLDVAAMLITQFWRAVTAQIKPEDQDYLKRHLPLAGRELFNAMAVCDQRHALNVAYTVEKLAAKKNIDRELLIRCALLHDVGRVRGDMDIDGKVLAVLLHKFFPQLAKKFACCRKKSWYPIRVMFVYYHHPWLGRQKLKRVGLTDEAEIICHHHDRRDKISSPLLDLLRQADNLN